MFVMLRDVEGRREASVGTRRLTALATRAPRAFLACVLCAAVAAAAFGTTGLSGLSPFNAFDPQSQSVKTRALLGAAKGTSPDFGLIVQVAGAAKTQQRRADRVVRVLRRDPLVSVVEKYSPGAPSDTTGDETPTLQLPRELRATYVLAALRPASLERQFETARHVRRMLEPIPATKLGGRVALRAEGNDSARTDLVRAELFAYPLLLVLMVWVFRGLVAALLPLMVAAINTAGALGAVRLVSEFTDVSIYALNVVTALGLGLAIDYSLLVLVRYREEAADAGYGRVALDRALVRTGPTVLCSSLTVAGAGAALFVFPEPFLRSIALGVMFVALLAGAAALSVLPAALAVLGPKVEALSLPGWQSAARRAARPTSAGFWYRLSQLVMRAPAEIAMLTAAALLLLAAPSVRLATTAVDAVVVPKSSPARQVAQALDGIGYVPPILVAVEPPAGTSALKVGAFYQKIPTLPGVAGVSTQRVRRDYRGRDLWRIDVTPAQTSLSKRSQELVRAIRSLKLPYLAGVGGDSADLVDLKQGLVRRLPLAVVLLVAFTMVMVFRLTGSIVLPLKTLLMNALTVAATFGILVVIFQDGRLEGLLGYTSSGALEASMLVLTFAVTYGLATDYGMFMLARIKEERDRGAGDAQAVALGLERSGRVISAAAMLLCVAAGSLITASHSLVKEVGIGVALAVAIDAFIVRALLVPSLMVLLGRFNWWAPAPLRALAIGGRRARRDPVGG
jgi:uncharacterized membrane protein YdfJ with MMPL/SSD domain